MKLKVEQKNNSFWFKRGDKMMVFSFSFTPYPSCCLLGILHGFSAWHADGITDEEWKEIGDYIINNVMALYDMNQLILADTANGGGYRLAEKMENAMPINVAFNDNSGNFVYMFVIYK